MCAFVSCSDLCADTCLDLCSDMCSDLCSDMCLGMCFDMCLDLCLDMCLDVCLDLCLDMCFRHVIRHACRRVFGRVLKRTFGIQVLVMPKHLRFSDQAGPFFLRAFFSQVGTRVYTYVPTLHLGRYGRESCSRRTHRCARPHEFGTCTHTPACAHV